MAKIYRITSTAGEKVYIGSTTRTLEERWREHRQVSNESTSKILFDEYGINTCSITVVEEVKEDDYLERERWWIENTPDVVNIVIPGRTYKEYYDDNREKMTEKNKVYRDSHKDYFDKKNREYRTLKKESVIEIKKNWASKVVSCELCNKEMRRGSLTTHKKTQHLSKVKLSNE